MMRRNHRATPIAAIFVIVGLLLSPAPPAHAADPKAHHIAIQVDVADPAVMNLALNNVANIYDYYRQRNEPVDIEVVAFGPGLAMLRDDISPVKARLTADHAAYPTLIFSACENSRRAASKAEGKEVATVAEARSVPAGVVRLSELQEQGWTYLRP